MSPPRRLLASALAVVLVAAGVPAIAQETPAPARPANPTPDQVRAELQAACRSLTEGGNLFFGHARKRQLESMLAQADQASVPPERTLGVRGAYAGELFRLGEVARAIEVLEAMRADVTEAMTQAEPQLEPSILSLLALARLRLAEETNCIEAHTPASCILPIAPEAVHRQPEEARRAGDLFLELLTEHGYNVQARWLLNLARMTSGDYPAGVPERYRVPDGVLPPADGPEAASGASGRWRDVSDALGVKAYDLAGGAVMEDLDGDGDLDLVSSTWDPCDGMKGFRNEGDGTFTDVSALWGLDAQLGAINLSTGDSDGDGRIDLFVSRGGWMGDDGRVRSSLLRNDIGREGAGGGFTDVTVSAGVASPAYPSQTAAWADFDGDGDLDVYVGNEASLATGAPTSDRLEDAPAFPSQLFRNDGGTFTDVARELGVTNDRWTKAAAWGDYDDDGDSDLFLSNIGPNRLYRNDGTGENGGFTDVAKDLGVTEPVLSFPAWWFDYDGDGRLDLFVGTYESAPDEISAWYLGEEVEGGRPRLYRNTGSGFEDATAAAGLTAPALPMGSNFGDFDNDGRPDVYLGTGVPNLNALMPNQAWRNRGGRFEDATFELGLGHLQKGHGVAFGDLDRDGDQDLFEQMGGAFPFDRYGNVVYRNPTSGSEGAARWIVLRLTGTKANRIGLGARVAVTVRSGESTRTVHHVVGSGGSFGASSLQAEIGLGDAEAIEEIVVRWPGSGTVQRFPDAALDAAYRATEGKDMLERLPYEPIALPDAPAEGGHEH
jgi:hypothetical protein